MSDEHVWIEPEALIYAGGKLWEREGKRRVYFNNLHEWIGLEFPNKGKYGGEKFPRLDGKPVQDHIAQRLLAACDGTRIFFDLDAQKWRAQPVDPRPGTARLEPEQIRDVIDRIKRKAFGEDLTGELPLYDGNPQGGEATGGVHAVLARQSAPWATPRQLREQAQHLDDTNAAPVIDRLEDRPATGPYTLSPLLQARLAMNWAEHEDGGACPQATEALRNLWQALAYLADEGEDDPDPILNWDRLLKVERKVAALDDRLGVSACADTALAESFEAPPEL